MKNTHQSTQMEMQKLCNTNPHFVIFEHYSGHEFKSFPIHWWWNILPPINDKNGCLLIQEIGIEKFGKINPTCNTFSHPWTSVQKVLFPNGLKFPTLIMLKPKQFNNVPMIPPLYEWNMNFQRQKEINSTMKYLPLASNCFVSKT
jgi:hypothetical protein